MRARTSSRGRRNGANGRSWAATQLSRRHLLSGALALATAGVLRGGSDDPALARSHERTPRRPLASADTIVVQWNNAALQAIRATKPGPPMVARALAILHTCIYDAWALYDPVAVGTRFGAEMRRPAADRTLTQKAEALSYAARHALSDLFPSEASRFDDLLTNLGYDPAAVVPSIERPSGLGTLCAQAVLDFRHGDGANQTGSLRAGGYADYTGYMPVNTPDIVSDPNRWQPLRVPDGQGGFSVQQYIGPQWGLVTPFALTSGAQFRPVEGPATYGTARYRDQVDQMLAYSANLTDEQKVIAEYWADGPSSELPPGHWCLFGQFVSRRVGHDLDADVQLFFALANAVFDAGIAAWDAKRAYDSVRPVTAIRYLYSGQAVRAWGGPGQGTQTIDGGVWQPYQAATVVTPPFPEFISGHSTFSAAADEVLQRSMGSDAFGASVTVPAGHSRFEPGLVPAQDVTLDWETFSAAADQAGLSRRYGGIHFEQGDLVGRAIGRLVGAQVWDRAQAYLSGAG
ncbi:MAG TPA: phosphoesterase [Dehalococcoidia bacterium]|nr:phosphoesterase [Dehalococcoidia bacterium]